MSRVAKKPISLPKGVDQGCQRSVTVKGPEGQSSFAQAHGVEIDAGTEGTLKSGDPNTTKYAARRVPDREHGQGRQRRLSEEA